MKTYISKLVSCCHRQLHGIRQVCCLVGQDVAQQLVSAFIFIMTRLLQLTVVSSAKVNHSAAAACDECSGSSHHEFVIARPRETSSEAATLAPSRAKNDIQAVSVHASHPHWTSTTIPVRLRIHSFCTQWQIPAEVNWLNGLRSAKNKN